MMKVLGVLVSEEIVEKEGGREQTRERVLIGHEIA